MEKELLLFGMFCLLSAVILVIIAVNMRGYDKYLRAIQTARVVSGLGFVSLVYAIISTLQA